MAPVLCGSGTEGFGDGAFEEPAGSGEGGEGVPTSVPQPERKRERRMAGARFRRFGGQGPNRVIIGLRP